MFDNGKDKVTVNMIVMYLSNCLIKLRIRIRRVNFIVTIIFEMVDQIVTIFLPRNRTYEVNIWLFSYMLSEWNDKYKSIHNDYPEVCVQLINARNLIVRKIKILLQVVYKVGAE